MKIKEKSFTLIELLVVISIIGLLASIVLVSLSTARAGAKDKKVIVEILQVRTIAETLVDTVYPSSFITPTNADAGCTKVAAANNDLYRLDSDVRAQNNITSCIAATPGRIIIQKQTGTGADSAYRAITKLPSKTISATAGLWCVDSAGSSKEIGTTGANGIPSVEAAGTAPTCDNAGN